MARIINLTKSDGIFYIGYLQRTFPHGSAIIGIYEKPATTKRELTMTGPSSPDKAVFKIDVINGTIEKL